ncbi:813df881-57ad-4403-a32d-77451475f054 [Sclerotinia trifoliorum]|uniref:DNA replication regulator SLD2 n=1 Tax=Sclerotinia trifoliorum TaxID=28548 RepID=A0A8H2W539_9HELO|nr:813df881-57ad-4403-a32d-77451475f054 [Sclerotinia trifoliorum]
MDKGERNLLEERSKTLRVELKVWEKDFQNNNQGRKASREDIKANPDIASKYKEFNKVRDILAGKISHIPPPALKATPRKRRHEENHNATPQKWLLVDRTPTKNTILPWDVDPYHSPSIMRNLFATPSKKMAIGPTPQKDGQVLGLFDLDPDSAADSPSTAHGTAGKLAATQSTPRKAGMTPGGARAIMHSNTPSSRRTLLFSTPLKNKTVHDHGSNTPSSVSKLHFNTPSFLRRDSQRVRLPAVDENEEGPPDSPEMVRGPRRPMIKSLSSMLAGLRKMEEDAADDDLEALNEMEAEMANRSKSIPKPKSRLQQTGSSTTPKSKSPAKDSLPEDTIIVDSQPRELLGGFDDEAKYDSESKEATNAPTSTFKKKGQKRTTRRVNLKPNCTKPSQPMPPINHHDASESEDELALPRNHLETIPETQLDDGIPRPGDDEFPEPDEFPPDGRNFDSDSASEYTASEGGTRYRRPDQNKTKKNRELNKEGKVKKAARKIKATAGSLQNFKRLKLRNSGAKGGPGVGSRFRRRK